jgi:hypothetical protein
MNIYHYSYLNNRYNFNKFPTLPKTDEYDNLSLAEENSVYDFYNNVSNINGLSDDFCDMFKDYLDWSLISCSKNLSHEFIRRFKDELDWKELSCQYLPEDLIEEFKDEVDWHEISGQGLSEEFITKFNDELHWSVVSRYQKLSKEFIIKFKPFIMFESIIYNLTVTEELIKIFESDVIEAVGSYSSYENDLKYCSNISNKYRKELIEKCKKHYENISL